MNELTEIRQSQPSTGYSQSNVTVELAKMLALVAPVTMSTDQQEVWLRAAVDSLVDIRADEIEAVSLEVRRSVTRPSQIVPEIAKLVADLRKQRSRQRQSLVEDEATRALLPVKKHIAERDRRNFTASDWAELNEWLELMGSAVRYKADGTKFEAS